MATNEIAFGTLNPSYLSEQHDSNNPLISQDLTSYKSHSSKIQDYLGLLSINKLQRNRVHSFDFEGEIPATIFILPNISEGSTGQPLPQSFSNFILTSVSEDRREKFQIFETFGDPALFFFNKKTPIYSFNGFLIDADHLDETRPGGITDYKSSWANEFRNLWEKEIRGTKLIENNKIAAISYRKTVIYGYPINLSIQTDSRQPFTAAFSFNMVVKKHKLEEVGNTFLDVRLFMTPAQRDAFDIGMKKLYDMEASLKDLQEQYEMGVSSGLSRDELANLESQISKKYTDTETIYLNVLTLIQSAISFPFTAR
ncbi:hypothetical protein AYK24_00615 [Thermoplasmatales archaeon SG8-52-4]|nr:MAG: hypothetical protein AYK24_00615 [Thermoplasmatales archaeon SG8-52-4]